MATNSLNGSIEGVSRGITAKTFFPVKVKRCIYVGNTLETSYLGGYDAIGTIYYTKIRNKGINEEGVNYDGFEKEEVPSYDGVARPLFSFQKQFPLINETVLVISTVSRNHMKGNNVSFQNYYLPPINLWNNPHTNNLPQIANYADEEETNEANIESYINEGLIRRTASEEEGEDSIVIPLGEYFREQLNIKPLLPYEGDNILEGRFGNSIRFGSTARHESIPIKDKFNEGWTGVNEWSKGAKGNIGDPITIIRNGQRVIWPDEELGKKGWLHTLEDINLDPSSIYLTSNQKIDNFLQASTNWQTFGANAVIPQSDQIEAKKCVDTPADHVTGKELGQDLEQDVEETKEEERKPTTEGTTEETTTEETTTEETTTEETIGLCGDAQLFPPYIKAVSGRSFTGTATSANEEASLDIAKSNSYDQLIQALKTQGYNDGDTLNFAEGKNVEYTKDNTWSEGYKEVTVTYTMTILNCDGTPVETPEKTITEEEAGLVEPEKESRYYDTPTEPEKEAIDGNLPEVYRLSDLDDVPSYSDSWAEAARSLPQEQAGYIPFFNTPDIDYANRENKGWKLELEGKSKCENCAFFKAGSSTNDNQCNKWSAKVRSNWYCDSYSNGLAEVIKNVKNIGLKSFTVISPDPHVGKKGYIAQSINVEEKRTYFEAVIRDTGASKRSPSWALDMDHMTVLKTIRRSFVPELLGLNDGGAFIKFDDSSFEAEIGEMKVPVEDKTIGYLIFKTPRLTRWKGSETKSVYEVKTERYSIIKRTNWRTDGTVSAAVLNLILTRKGSYTREEWDNAEDAIIALGNLSPNTTDASLKEQLLAKAKQEMVQRKYTYTKKDKDYNVSPNNQSTITLG